MGHIYNVDFATTWLNNAVLSYAEVPIYHAGIEVYGTEVCFNYYEDTWDNPEAPGVMLCDPRRNDFFEYQSSICLGPTPLSRQATMKLITKLCKEWPANSYHITRRNCLTFADCLVRDLRT